MLVEQGRLVIDGLGRATRYRLPAEKGVEPEAGFYPPLSADGQAIRDAVRAPQQQREPVSYQRDFLDAYRPNETFYLPAVC